MLTSTLPHSLLVSYAALDLSKTFLRKVLFFHPCKVGQLPVVQFLPVTLLQASNWLAKPLVLASDLLLLDTNCNIFGSSLDNELVIPQSAFVANVFSADCSSTTSDITS